MLIDKYKHISFDLDGTLIHTTPEYRHKIVPAVVNKLGGKITDKYHIDRFWFEHDRDNIIQECFNLNPIIFWNVLRKLDTAENRNLYASVYGDAEPAIKKLKETDKIISMITNAPKWATEMGIKKLNSPPIDIYLSLGNNNEAEWKPNPKGMHFIVNKIGSSKKETLYIGNSQEDALFAKNAGVDFVHIERNEHPFDLKEYAIATINSLDELFV